MAEHDLHPDQPYRSKIVLATIANTPSSSSDSLYVTIPSWPSTGRWGPCPWTPHNAALPAAGTQCLVAFPDDGPVPWIIAWVGPWIDLHP